ncbi:hypothetical protein HMI01_12690 [Halolactibacillus miurensis]|uniref:DUF1798 family protein n=1 Tax=Halolactibacillus miurensis TaxID=306541 RepID=A0A1I6SY56_9BACI|nr:MULTISPECIES: DUF1798 family protein [Halolactibacillus]GEM04281.1 hypothetical protein HMI01_12690 [Halolactibacillus miurensis]SFS81859.1 protein of unknown function [Halolactibacillus miurensis]
MSVLSQTETIDQIKQACFIRYQTDKLPAKLNDREAFNVIKEEVTPQFQLMEQWEDQLLSDIKTHALSIHPSLVQSTRENMELIIMHSFYHDTDEKRFHELVKSVDVVLDMVRRVYQHD